MSADIPKILPDDPAAAAIPHLIKLDQLPAEPLRALFDGRTMQPPTLIKHQVIRSMRQLQRSLDEVEANSQKIIEAAQAEADAIRQEAARQGREEAAQELATTLLHARSEYSRLMREAEPDMIAIALKAAERIVHTQIALHPDTLRSLLIASLELVRDKRQITLIIHPDDLDIVSAWRHELDAIVEARAIFFEPDPSLPRASCLIETEGGRIDARLDTQLDNLKRAMMP